MSHSNISIFVPHIGCPHLCSFCNQHTISGAQTAPSAEDVRRICTQAAAEIKNPENTEIAFFGGSFTAIPRAYMLELLEAAHDFVGEGKFKGIRISTRPDCIDRDVLELLKEYGVTAIELGAQSMCDEVLAANDRGHTADDVVKASGLIKEYGFELGLQIMVGLYKSHFSDECITMDKVIEIHPDTVRIYPVVILKGTKLAELYESGEYVPVKTRGKMRAVIGTVSMMLRCFEKNGIRVIKCGLHASEFVEKDMIGGFYHPAFRELCEARIYRSEMKKRICENAGLDRVMSPKNFKYNYMLKYDLNVRDKYVFAVNPSCISKALGHRKSNYQYFREAGIEIKIVGDEQIPKYQCELRG